MSDLIQVRKGTSAQWAAANPILAEGEPGYDTTTGDFKIGNGVTAWASLPAPTNSRYTLTDVPWISISGFTNSWVNFGAPANDCQYQKIGNQVYLRGAMKTGTIGSTSFTLPAGFRPPATLSFATTSNSLFGSMAIDSAGVFTPIAGSNVIYYINCNFSTVA